MYYCAALVLFPVKTDQAVLYQNIQGPDAQSGEQGVSNGYRL